MIHRRHEGGETRYGLNWQAEKRTFSLIISVPIWILKYSLYWGFAADYILMGERILGVMVGFRWSRVGKKFYSRCWVWKKAYRQKIVATREQIEDGTIVMEGLVKPFDAFSIP